MLLHFGLPTVPAEARCTRSASRSPVHRPRARARPPAGLYSLAVKLAGAVAFIVRAFQYAWPPLAYSVTDDAQAAGSTVW